MFGDDTEYPYGYNLWAMGEEEDRQNKEDKDFSTEKLDFSPHICLPGTCQHYGIEPCECDQGMVDEYPDPISEMPPNCL